MTVANRTGRENAESGQHPKITSAQKQLGGRIQIDGAKTKARRDVRSASKNGNLTRVDMIAAILKRHPRRAVRQLISLLDKEFRWKTTESAVASNLYTRPDKFAHTQTDRATNRPSPGH